MRHGASPLFPRPSTVVLAACSDLLAGSPERPPREDQHIQAIGPQIAFLVDEIGVDVFDEHFPLEQVMVAERDDVRVAIPVDESEGSAVNRVRKGV